MIRIPGIVVIYILIASLVSTSLASADWIAPGQMECKRVKAPAMVILELPADHEGVPQWKASDFSLSFDAYSQSSAGFSLQLLLIPQSSLPPLSGHYVKFTPGLLTAAGPTNAILNVPICL